MAKKKVKEIKALLSKNDWIKIIDRNKKYRVYLIEKTNYILKDEQCNEYNYGIVGVDNAIEKSKSIIKL